MADEQMSTGETKERFRGIDKRLDGIDTRLDRMLPTETFAMADRHTAERIADVDRAARERDDDLERSVAEQFKEIKDGKADARTRILQVAAIAATLAAAWLTAYLASKGAK